MNIGSLTSASRAPEGPRENRFKTIREDFKNLQSALKSGDLSSAQDAYNTLKQDLPAPRNNPAAGSSKPATDLDAIGTALQSGDLSGAQQALQSFQQDVRGAGHAHGHHHHHHAESDGDSSSSAAVPAPAASGIQSQSFDAQA